MEFRDAVKYLRSELGLTQVELAAGLHMNAITIGRWENGKTLPTRSITAVLLAFARSKGASEQCLDRLTKSISSAAKEKLDLSSAALYAVEHASLRQLIDDAAFPIYVCDMETDELLYLNQKACAMVGAKESAVGRKCYECLMHREDPCAFCHKNELVEGKFKSYDAYRPFDGVTYHVQGKLIQWNGRRAQVRYVLGQELTAKQRPAKTETEADAAQTDPPKSGGTDMAKLIRQSIEIERSTEQLKAIFEHINGGVSVVAYGSDDQVCLAYANDHYYELFGYTKQQFVSELKDPHDTLYPDDAESVGEAIGRIKATRQPGTFRYRIVKRDKSIAYIRCNSSFTSIDGLSDKVMISVLADVTASVKAEQQAIVSGQRLDAIMKNMVSAVTATVIKSDGSVEFLFSNDRYHEILGFTKEQYRNEVSDPFRLVHRDDVEAVLSAVAGLKNVGDERELRYRIITRDGQIKWIKARISMMSFPDAEAPVQLAVYTDVTDTVEATRRLAAQHDQITEVLNETPSGVAVIEVDPRDVAGTLHTVYYNDRFFSFSGYGRDEYDALLKKNEMAFVFNEDVPILLADTEKMCKGEIGASADSTVRCHTKDGGFRWLLLTGQLVGRRGEICIINIALIDVTARKEAIDRQRISEEMLRIAAETDQRAMIVYDVKNNSCRVESRTLFSAKYGETFFNIPQSLVEKGIVARDSADELGSLFNRIRNGEQEIRVSLEMHSGADKYEWFECNAAAVFDDSGNPDHAVLVFHNITEQRVKEAVFKKWQQSIDTRPAESYTLFRCNLSKDASLDEQDGNLLKIKFPSEVLSFNARTKLYTDEFVYPDDREAYAALLNSDALLAMFYRGEHSATLDYRETGKNGETAWRRLTVEMVEYLNATDVQAFLMYEDIDEAKKAEIEAKELAETDPLTGALNRAAFAQKVDDAIRSDPSTHNALIMLDMDGFKQLNDTFGHAAGDQALQEVVAVLRAYIRSGDLVCRLGGDEFLVWLSDVPYDAVIAKTAQQMCEHIKKAYSQEVLLSASAGVAVYPRDGHGYDELYPNADKALYKVKQSGKGSYAFFSVTGEEQTPEIAEALSAVRPAEKSVRGAKRRILIVDDNETNRIVLKGFFKDEYLIETAKNGVEAMIRLRHFGVSISVVLLDLVMPGVDGFAVLKKMQSNAELRTIPAIVVTGDEEHATLLKAIELGAAEYVTKPVDADLLRMRVRSVISKAENERLRAQNSYLMLQRDEEVKYRTVLESTGTVVVEYDWRNHVFIYDSEISKHIAGSYDHRSLWQVFLSDMVADSSDAKTMQDMLIALACSKEVKRDTRLVKLKTPSFEKHWFRMNIYKSEDAFGLAEKMILTFNDVDREVLANDKLLFQATRDELTGLYNRAGFIEKAEELIAAKEQGYYVMACIDIEKFKVVNDQYGTAKGDEILQKFARALENLHRGDKGICCRITADNFAILYPAHLIDSPELEQSHWAVAHLDNTIPVIQFAAGRCLVDDKTLSVAAIYDRAVIAKNTVKGRYDKHIAMFDESMRTAILRQQEITGQMKSALESGQFEVWLQPQFNHATGMLSGAEALVRWRHPVEGIISPVEFIPIFERNGFVYEVDKYVWEQTCMLLSKWLDQGLNPVPVSVNISRYDVFRDDLISTIEGLVKKYDLPLALLRLEITESAFSESAAQIIKVAEALVDKGFTVEIDDFGSGYSSLNTLKDVPAQVLKMDMRFLENDQNAQRGGSIIESVVRMAKWLGMSVIAEGVETIEQADYLKSIGCNYIQGYLYSKPMQVVEYEKLFADRKTESMLGKLKSVETWNNSAFWNPTSMETLIFNSYVGGACIFEYSNGKTELLRYNAGYEEIFGGDFQYGPKDAHSNIFSVLDDENAALLHACIDTAIATKKEASCEIKLIGSNREIYIYFRATMRQIAEAGERHLFYCVVSDHTEQRAAEKRQMESKRQLEVVMNNIHGGVTATVFHSKDDMEIIFSNDGFYEMYGYTKAQLEAEVPNMLDLIFTEDREQTMETVARIVRERGSETYEYRCHKRDGGTVYIQCTNSVISLDGIGDAVLLAVTTDVTALREAQQDQAATMDRLEAVMNAMQGGMTAVAFRGDKMQFLFANNRYYEMHGIQRGSIGEDHLSDVLNLVIPENREMIHNLVQNAAKTGCSASAEYRIQRPDGAIRWVRAVINMVSLVGIDAPVQVTIFTDITEIKQANNQLRFLNDSARDILSQPDSDAAIQNTLQSLMSYFSADRSYVVELDYDRNVTNNTYEVCADGVGAQMENLRGLPFGPADYWYAALCRHEFLVIEDVNAMDDGQAALRAMLIAQGIRSIILAPLWREGRLIGFVGLDNPARALEQVKQLASIADYMTFVLTRRDLSRKIAHDMDAIETLMNDTPGGFVRMAVHPGGNPTIVSLNEGMCRMLGMTKGEAMAAYGDDAHRFFTPAEIEETAKKVLDARACCGQYSCKCTLHCKGDKNIPVMALGRFVKDESGNLFLNAYFTDITEQTAAEERQKALLDNLPTGAAMYAFDGEKLTAIHINKQYWNLVERAPVDYGNASVMCAIHPDDREIVRQEIAAAIRQHRKAEVDVRILCGEDDYKPFSLTANITPQNDGTYLLFVSYSSITDDAMSLQKMLPVALSTMMAASGDISYIKDKDLRYICASQSLADMTGFESTRDLIGKSACDLFDSKCARRFTKDDQKVVETREPVIGTIEHIPFADGSMHLGRTSKYPIMDASGKAIGVYCVCSDVTAQKQKESQLELLTSTIPGGIAAFRCTETEYRLSYFNDGFCALFGYSKAEFHLSMDEILNLVFEQDRAAVEAQIAGLVKGGTPVNCVCRIHTKDGGYRWVSHNAVLADRVNDAAIINAVFLDITEQQEEKERLRLAEEEYRIATRHSGHTIGRYNIAARTLTISEDAAAKLSLPECIPDVPYGRVNLGKISKATALDYIAFYERIKNGEKECSVTFQKLLSIGWRWINERATTIFGEDGKPVSAIISYSDVTEQQEKEAVYKKWQQNLIERGPESYTLYRCNLNQDSTYDSVEGSLLNAHRGWNDAMSFNERTADFAKRCVAEEDRARYIQFVNSDAMLASYYRGRRTADLEFRCRITSGEMHWMRLSVELVEYPNTKDVSAYLMYEDINDSKTTEIRTREEAETDPLTGLLNRKAFAQKVNELIQKTSPGTQHAFFMLDIDGFKMLNDTFGHAAGDEALVEVAQKLRTSLRGGDVLGRLGGDEFVLFLTDISDEASIGKKARRICEHLLKAYSVEIQLSASIGVALYPRDGLDSHALYEKADTALYSAKENGRNTFKIYSQELPKRRAGADPHEMDVTAAAARTVAQTKIRRMLIVDDNEIDRTLLKNLFEKEYLVDVALDGMSALSRMRYYGSALSVVLLDLHMGGLSGFDVLDKAKDNPEMRGIPIIVVSGENDSETCMRAIRAGAADFVMKPVQAELIRLRINAVISRAENERLRAQNSFLQLRGAEISRYQMALNGMGMFVVELDWIKGIFAYDPAISRCLKGTYDGRTLWRILLSDMVADALDVKTLQEFIHELADDHGRSNDAIEIPLRTPSNKKHRFKLTVEKVCNADGLTQKLMIVFKDLDI